MLERQRDQPPHYLGPEVEAEADQQPSLLLEPEAVAGEHPSIQMDPEGLIQRKPMLILGLEVLDCVVLARGVAFLIVACAFLRRHSRLNAPYYCMLMLTRSA